MSSYYMYICIVCVYVVVIYIYTHGLKESDSQSCTILYQGDSMTRNALCQCKIKVKPPRKKCVRPGLRKQNKPG